MFRSRKDEATDNLSSSSKTDLLSSSKTMLDNMAASENKTVARIPGEKDLNIGAKLSGIELILSDHHGNLLSAKIKGNLATVYVAIYNLSDPLTSDLESKVTIDEKSVNVSARYVSVNLALFSPLSIWCLVY